MRPISWGDRRRHSSAVLATALALLVAGCSTDGSNAPSPTRSSAAPGTTTAPASTAASPSVTVAPAATPAQVLAAERIPLSSAALGPDRFGVVVDLASGTTLLDHQASTPIPPASTIKLLTARAALRTLGAATRLVTKVVATSAPDATGTVHGDLWLVGAGDPTLTTASPPDDPATATITGLAGAVQASGVRHVTGRIYGDGSLFTDTGLPAGWNPSYISGGSVGPRAALAVDGGRTAPSLHPAERVANPPLTAAQDLNAALRGIGVTVAGTSSTGTAPAGAPLVGSVDGLPIGSMVRRMLTQSDDDIAEDLARVVASKTGKPVNASGVGQVEVETATQLGAPAGSVTAYDASGLSRLDRVPLSVLVASLRGAPTDVLAGLAVAGSTGTLANRFHDSTSGFAAGRVRAKTGALIGITTLVGVARLPSGRDLAFGFGGDQVPVRESGEAALDACAAALTKL